MNKTTIIILLAIILIGSFFIFYKNRPVEQNTSVAGQINQQTNTKQKLVPKVDDQASVTVTVTPVDISSESKEWKFNINMITHSVELDQDMIKSAVLVDDQGKEYIPINWEGPNPGGHHITGTLVFNTINPRPTYLELKIKYVGGIPNRLFKWNFE